MKFLFSLLVVLSLLAAPFVAQAAGICDSQGCVSFSVDKDAASAPQSDSKSTAAVDHCCTNCHVISGISFTDMGEADISALTKLPVLKDSVLRGHDPQGLLRPPQAA